LPAVEHFSLLRAVSTHVRAQDPSALLPVGTLLRVDIFVGNEKELIQQLQYA
jgi:hypothetical protein